MGILSAFLRSNEGCWEISATLLSTIGYALHETIQILCFLSASIQNVSTCCFNGMSTQRRLQQSKISALCPV